MEKVFEGKVWKLGDDIDTEKNGFVAEFALRYHHRGNIVSGGTGEGVRVGAV